MFRLVWRPGIPTSFEGESIFWGRGPTHSSLCWRGDLVKTLSRWPWTHLDLKVDPPRPGVQVKHLWYARTSNEHSYHPRLVVPCLHHFAQDHGTLHMRRHSCGNARILRYLGVKCQKKKNMLCYHTPLECYLGVSNRMALSVGIHLYIYIYKLERQSTTKHKHGKNSATFGIRIKDPIVSTDTHDLIKRKDFIFWAMSL